MPRPTCSRICLYILLACTCLEAEPLTLGQLASTSTDTLTAIVDFDRARFGAIEDSIRAYWTAFPGIEVVRFISSAEAARDSLADSGRAGTLLYGTLDARPDNPVFEAFSDTWLEPLQREAPEIQNENETGIIAVSKHPFTHRGFVGVIAATSADFLPAMHQYYDRSQSLVLVFHGRVDHTAIYDARFRKMITEISRDEALEDVELFFNTIERAHPQPLLHLSPESYLELKQGMSGRLGLEDADAVSKTALAVELAKAAAALEDGHTSVVPSSSLVDQTNPDPIMLPVYLKYSLGGLYVASTTAATSQLEGRRLVAIDGRPVLEYLAPVLEAISGERVAKKLTTFIWNQHTYWALLAPDTDSEDAGHDVTLTTMDRSGTEYQEFVQLISVPSYTSAFHDNEYQVGDFHEFHHEQKTCYYRFDSFQNSAEQLVYADSLFAELDGAVIQNLVVDLRFNGGGNSAFGDYLLDYLTDVAYRKAARMDVKLSELLYDAHEGYREFDNLTGMTISRQFRLEQPQDRGNRFKGNLYVLVGPQTFSSAGMFAAMVKDFHIGTLIGEETGAARQCFGEVLRVDLPNSGLSLNVSTKQWFAPVPQFDDSRRGTVPDILVDDGVLESYPDSEDPILSFALDYIARHTK